MHKYTSSLIGVSVAIVILAMAYRVLIGSGGTAKFGEMEVSIESSNVSSIDAPQHPDKKQEQSNNEQSLALQKSERIADLYKRINDIDITMVELNIRLRKLGVKCDEAKKDISNGDYYLLCNEKVNVTDQMDLYSREYARLENELSQLEGRPPRKQYTVKQPPKPPSW